MSEPVHSPLVKFPPPVAFLLAFLAGWAIDRYAWPVALVPDEFGLARRVVAWLLVAAGIALSGMAVLIFRLARTTIIPHNRPSALVIIGPYRFTRNPMYVALTTIYVGAAGAVNTPWPFLFLPLPLLFLQRVMIPFEEQRLHGLFGEAFAAYCRRVRRWL